MTEKKSAPVHGAPFYTRGEEIMNAVTHGVGAARSDGCCSAWCGARASQASYLMR